MASHIFINDNIPSHTTMRGVTRYFRKIVDGLIAQFGDQVTIYSSDRRDYGSARHLYAPRFRGIRRLGIHDRLASLVAARESVSVLYSAFFGTTQTRADQVFTVHDILLEMHLREHKPLMWQTDRYVVETRSCVERASLLLAVSQSTARDLRTLYPDLPAQKIVVTLEGVAAEFFAAPAHAAIHDRPYLLYVGERSGHKNFTRFLRAFGESGVARTLDLLVVSRTHGLTAEEQRCIEEFRISESLRFLAPVPDPVLHAAYANAWAFVYPSAYEGFGLPILEALASGTIVATSNISSMPEVGGESAFYFDPLNIQSMAHCLDTVAGLPLEQRLPRIEAGRQWARKFTWERCSQLTNQAIQSLME